MDYIIYSFLIPNSDDRYCRFLLSMCETRSLLSIMFIASLKLFQMLSDMVLLSALLSGPRPDAWKLRAVRKCSAASL